MKFGKIYLEYWEMIDFIDGLTMFNRCFTKKCWLLSPAMRIYATWW